MNESSYAGDVMPAEAWKRLQDDPRAVLVDVRTDAEWRFVGIPDLAPIGKQVRLVEWQTFPDGRPNPGFAGEVAGMLEKDQPVYFLCRSGARSPSAPAGDSGAGPSHHALDRPAVLDVGTGCGEQSTALEPTGSDDEQG